jgi:hypothetical protein
MKKTAYCILLLALVCILPNCSGTNQTNTVYATNKIMSVTQAAAFIKSNAATEGKEIIITAQSCGVIISADNTISLSLADDAYEDEIKKINRNNFTACFSNQAAEYAREVPDKATVTISGKISHINGIIQLSDCVLIAQN